MKTKERILTLKFYTGFIWITLLIFICSMTIFAFHDIDLAYMTKDSDLDHYNLLNDESKTPDELYAIGWGRLFAGITILFMMSSFWILNTIVD